MLPQFWIYSLELMRLSINLILCSVIISSFLACQSSEAEQPWVFEKVSKEHTGIDFVNSVRNTKDFNIFLYRNFYNGGGVAIGDINNDGLQDVYFTSNMGENKLYLNKGALKFEDITSKAGVASADKWSTGVVLVDINADGLLDIYVCNAGYRKGSDQKNELFINNGDLTFSEKAEEYGLDENGYTTHAAFFDYDKDGDLDVYILNNSFMPVNTLNYSNKRELPADQWPVKDFLKGGGDKFLKNEGGKFVDITHEAGIYNSLIGFGLGITVGDVNGDNWEDIYVSNDFFERDYLYLNQQDGTFKERIKDQMGHISAFSMGADMADINNDSKPDIFVTDMLPDNDQRLKSTSSFEPYSVYELKLDRDFYHQYMQNTLQLNNGNNSFSEVAYYSGVSSSDWSWGALLFDINNDGYRDIYVCNGIYHDVTDQDFIDFFANDMIQKMALAGGKDDINSIISKMPSNPIKNKVFMNNKDLQFDDISEHAENTPSFSNGAAYGDLDNDGDLDLVINNVNQEAFVFRNNTRETTGNHYLKVQLKGSGPNSHAIGSKLTLYHKEGTISSELIPSRGFQSSVDYSVIFGLGSMDKVDSLQVVWPDQSISVVSPSAVDTLLTIRQDEAGKLPGYTPAAGKTDTWIQVDSSGLERHQEDDFVDFYKEGLVIRMLSREGPKTAVADVNGDGLEDAFICGAYRQAGQLYIQDEKGLVRSEQPEIEKGAYFEDTAARFFDADGDGDQDLFVGSGGNHDYQGAVAMQDRLYLNDGKGNFKLFGAAFPNNGYNTAVAVPLDFDADGDLDLFVGSRSIPGNYGVSPKSYLYQNDGGGKFADVTAEKAASLKNLGMLTEAALADINGNGKQELVIVGEWMHPVILEVAEGQLKEISTGMQEYSGWWNTIATADTDNDGDQDLILGNRGENFYFSGTFDAPAKLWVHDFDDNGTVDKILSRSLNGRDVSIHLKKELTQQIASLKKQNLKHSQFADKSIQELFAADVLQKATVREGTWFKSSVAVNDGTGKFTMVPLPAKAQLSSVNSIYTTDINNDGSIDLILGGNNSAFLPQFSKLDASYGQVLINNGNGSFKIMESAESGFFVKGDIRQFSGISIGETEQILVMRNNDKPVVLKLNKPVNQK